MTSYQFYISQSRRWDKCVDFGSPMSAWSKEMFEEWNKARVENRSPSMKNVKNK